MKVVYYAKFPMLGWELTVTKQGTYIMAVAYNVSSQTVHLVYRYVDNYDAVEEPDPKVPQEIFDVWMASLEYY